MAEIPDVKDLVQQAVHDAVKQIRFTVNDLEVSLDELGTIIRRYNAIPVVRCELCKHWDDTEDGRYVGGWCFCEKLQISTAPDWYCANGELRDDNEY